VVFPLDRGWLYAPETFPGWHSPALEEDGFVRVSVPHANRELPWHSFDDADYQFVSVYRRRFGLPGEVRRRRVFADFDGVMASARVAINGEVLGEHRGGYTPFSFELTGHLEEGENLLAVEVDSRERPDVPPFGGRIDYLTFGGIYRDVSLRVVPDTFIEDVFARPVGVLREDRRVEARCLLDSGSETYPRLTLRAELRDGERLVAEAGREVEIEGPGSRRLDLSLEDLGGVRLWDSDSPELYRVVVSLLDGDELLDRYETRVGFREARFTPEGFFLNGRHLKLRGLNRHQTYPFVGGAMPERVQRRDAIILKHELKCNVVRTSHYPQSPHFLDACDEIGLLVFEEIPGWQHVGDEGWKEFACRDVEAMIRRDRNRPSVILWGVRINESPDDHDF